MTDYITIDQLADLMQVDELLLTSAELSIAAAQQSVRRYLDQELTLVLDDEEIRDGNGKSRMRLKERPVREVAAIYLDDDVDPVDPTEYVVRGGIISMVGSVFPHGVGNVSIIYTHGWDLVEDSQLEFLPFPPDITLVTLLVARRIYMAGGAADTSGIQSETIGNYSYSKEKAAAAGELLAAEKAVLDPYAVRLVP